LARLKQERIAAAAQRVAARRLDERQQGVVDEEQLAIPVAVGEGPESLRPQSHGVVEPDPIAELQPGSVDPTHAVDGDLPNQDVPQVLVAQLGTEIHVLDSAGRLE